MTHPFRFAIALSLAAFLPAHALADDSAAPSDQSEESDQIVVPYEGELLDQENLPISGVFELTFRLYAAEGDERPAWSERQYVSVHVGSYDVVLGGISPLSRHFDGRELFLAVELDSLGEIVRHSITLQSAARNAEARDAELSEVQFAHVADRALLAEHARTAETCETLGGKTADEIADLSAIRAELDTLRATVQSLQNAATGGGGQVSLGSRTVTIERIGGAGGRPYRRNCPPNHVVVGASGGDGDLVDSIALICAPME